MPVLYTQPPQKKISPPNTYPEFGVQHAHFKVIFTAFGLRFAEFYEAHLDFHYEIIKGFGAWH